METTAKTGPAPETPKFNILVLCIHSDIGEAFANCVCSEVPTPGARDIVIGDQSVHLELLAGDPRVTPTWDEMLLKANAFLLLVRFMDVISLDKIRAIYRRIPGDQPIPLAIVILREEGEADFKISCPACGQKLWVSDAEADKRGRCPNCKKAFKLPSQTAHIKAQLMLPDNIPTITATRDKSNSCKGALTNIMTYYVSFIKATRESAAPAPAPAKS